MRQSIPLSLDFLRPAVVSLATALLCACSTVQIHDESRAKLAASGKKDYADVKVTEVIEADRKNAEFLLAAEIAAVRENAALQVDFATLEIANNKTPMNDTFRDATARRKALGFETIVALRESFDRDATLQDLRRKTASLMKVFNAVGVKPDCDKSLEQLEKPATLTATQLTNLKSAYRRYLDICEKSKSVRALPGGLIGQADVAWRAADVDADEADIDRQTAEKLLKAAKAAYDEQVKKIDDAQKKGQKIAEDLKEAAEKAKEALDQAGKLAAHVEEKELKKEIDALVQILTAVAGGEIDTQDPDIKKAAAVAKQIPLIAADIAQMEATRTAPPVSGLLLALRHRTLLAEAARKRALLEEERVAILKAKYEAYYDESRYWLRFHDAICNYAALAAGKPHPGASEPPPGKPKQTGAEACNVFDGLQNGACAVGYDTLGKCALGTAWRDAFRDKTQPAAATRELYKAVTNYLQATALQGVPFEQDFRQIDVLQRETLLAKSSALETWDNLLTVPIEQLDGYYQGGIKPAEIADLILKALTFTAIAIGVSK